MRDFIEPPPPREHPFEREERIAAEVRLWKIERSLERCREGVIMIGLGLIGLGLIVLGFCVLLHIRGVF